MELIHVALKEDMPNGDLTTDSMALAPRFGQARLMAKEDLVLSGAVAFEQTILALDPMAKIQWHFKEGDLVLSRQILCHITGDLIQVLKAERVALNFIGHLSGIATYTRCFVKQVEHTKTRILDTRKTLPAFRELEKKAVAHGGGMNHRFNLSDAILIKENHITVAGGITNAVKRIREHTKEVIEVECSTLDEIKEAVALNVDRILLDNMPNELMTEALKIIPQPIKTEASGNMTVDRVKSVAELGVDFISVGALTHSAPNADVSLLFDWQQTELAPI
jgi:nicotinate-nucleotide pyrophosphorylase (carboxylating)